MKTSSNAFRSLLRSSSHPRPFTTTRCRQRPLLLKVRAQDRNVNGAPAKEAISEDVLQRLRVAEEEAAKLRAELAKAKAEALAKVRSMSINDRISIHHILICRALLFK